MSTRNIDASRLFDATKIEPDSRRPPSESLRAWLRTMAGLNPDPKALFTYRDLASPRHPNDRRGRPRHRSRLNSATLVDRNLRPIVECSFIDVSETGRRLRLERDAPLGKELRLQLHGDKTLLIGVARWRSRSDVGVHLLRAEQAPAAANARR